MEFLLPEGILAQMELISNTFMPGLPELSLANVPIIVCIAKSYFPCIFMKDWEICVMKRFTYKQPIWLVYFNKCLYIAAKNPYMLFL